MSKLQERVERMELKTSPQHGVNTIFVAFLGADNGKPVELPIMGWRFTRNKETVDVFRLEEETDEDLEKRAETIARQHLPDRNVVMLTQII